jgi:hypothetical protein
MRLSEQDITCSTSHEKLYLILIVREMFIHLEYNKATSYMKYVLTQAGESLTRLHASSHPSLPEVDG